MRIGAWSTDRALTHFVPAIPGRLLLSRACFRFTRLFKLLDTAFVVNQFYIMISHQFLWEQVNVLLGKSFR